MEAANKRRFGLVALAWEALTHRPAKIEKPVTQSAARPVLGGTQSGRSLPA